MTPDRLFHASRILIEASPRKRLGISTLVDHLWALGMRPYKKDDNWEPVLREAGLTVFFDESYGRGATFVCVGEPDYGDFEHEGLVLVDVRGWFFAKRSGSAPKVIKFTQFRSRARIWTRPRDINTFARRHNIEGFCTIGDTRYLRGIMPAVVS